MNLGLHRHFVEVVHWNNPMAVRCSNLEQLKKNVIRGVGLGLGLFSNPGYLAL